MREKLSLLAGQVLFIVGSQSSPRYSVTELVEAALAGGVKIIELREKEMGIRPLLDEAEEIAERVRRGGGILLINDRVEVALSVGERTGVHLGLEDFPIWRARRLLGPDRIIGATCRNAQHARRAFEEGANYLSAGTVFASPTKPALPVRGLEVVRELKAAALLPVCAIGGIRVENVESVARAGADLIAVSSAIASADNPQEAARRLVERFRATYQGVRWPPAG